jgi:ubiquinol-cytochrome c reductase iron-sulfur subunit
VRRLRDWLVACGVLVAARVRRREGATGDRRVEGLPPSARERPEERIVPSGPPSPRAELVVIGLLLAATLTALAFVAVYAVDRVGHQTQWLGVCLGGTFVLLAVACIVSAGHLIVTEENEEQYPEPDGSVDEQDDLVELVHESGSRITRRGLLTVVAGGAAAALGLALVVPAASLGPVLDWNQLVRTPWRRGRRLVDENGRPLLAADVAEGVFYTAYPEGGRREDIGAPVVLVRLPEASLQLPQERHGWAPKGILAFSKICTHAGCAISLYRSPLYEPTAPEPALVCPCHYSTFDPRTGGEVLFGPAGRPLPQLPLRIGRDGSLLADGAFSSPPGPSWWSVRTRAARP